MRRLAVSFLACMGVLAATVATATAPVVAEGIDKYVNLNNRPKSISEPQYTADGTAILRLDADCKKIVKEDISTGKVLETVFDVSTARETKLDDIEGFTMSPEGSRILVWRDRKMIYRRSFTAEFYVYEIRSRILQPLSTTHERQREPLFSPDGSMVAYVGEDNNIYLRKLTYNTEVAVTTDGKVNEVINGVPDWTYEEEFYTTCSMAWSPDNEVLCYLKYNESKVPVYDFPLYEGSCNPMTEYALYPGTFAYKYPVAGQPNSVVTVNSYDVMNRKTKTVELKGEVEYIPNISFAYSPDRLMVVTLNRSQTRMELFAVNPKSLVSKSVLVEQSKAWLDPNSYEKISFNPDGIVLFSSRSGYTHLYTYSYTGTMTRQLTSGNFDVTDYYGYDAKHGRHFYQSTATGPINKVVSSVDAKGSVKKLSPDNGTARAWLSPAGDYYTINYSSVDTPPCYTLYSSSGDKKLRVIEDNKEYARKFEGDATHREFFTFNTIDGVSLNGFMVKPSDFNPSKKYPVIMYQYSGPGSQEVVNAWSKDWINYFANEGYIIACVDGRGTGGRGREFMDVVYKDLGHYETIDQSAAATYMAGQPYVDAKRVGIFGWSYGGYETLMCLTTGTFPYAAGVAVAPVTDWRYYDTVYAERYMLTPGENEDGYKTSAPINYVEGLKVPLLIMHGTADDNVHLSNVMEYVSKMECEGRFCDMLLFPNMNHSIYGCNSREMVYSKMLDYFNRNMK